MLEQVWRRVRNMVAFGTVNSINDSGPVQMAQVGIGHLETRDNTPVVYHFGFSSNPPADSDVALNFVHGDRSNGAIVGSNHQPSRRKGLSPGESSLYNVGGVEVYVSNGGVVVNAQNLPVTVNGATLVTINAATKVRMVTPRLEVTGDIIDNCDTQTETAANWRAIYDIHTHNYNAGTTPSVTAVPNQQET